MSPFIDGIPSSVVSRRIGFSMIPMPTGRAALATTDASTDVQIAEQQYAEPENSRPLPPPVGRALLPHRESPRPMSTAGAM